MGPIQIGQSSSHASAGRSSVVVMLMRSSHEEGINPRKSSQFWRGDAAARARPLCRPARAGHRIYWTTQQAAAAPMTVSPRQAVHRKYSSLVGCRPGRRWNGLPQDLHRPLVGCISIRMA